MRTAILMAVVCVAGSACFAQETIDNPEFKNWSKFKKGTSITMKTVSEAAGQKSEITMTTTLLETGDDKLVVETSSATIVMNMEFKVPPMKHDVPKTITLPKGTRIEKGKDQKDQPKPEGTYEEGTETLKIGGVEVKTKWYKYKNEVAGIKTEAKTWMSDDVPGMFVKMEATSTGVQSGTTRTEIVEFKKP